MGQAVTMGTRTQKRNEDDRAEFCLKIVGVAPGENYFSGSTLRARLRAVGYPAKISLLRIVIGSQRGFAKTYGTRRRSPDPLEYGPPQVSDDPSLRRR